MSNGKSVFLGCLILLIAGGLLTTGIVFGVRALINRGKAEPADPAPVAEEALPAAEEAPAVEAAAPAEAPAIDENLTAWEAFLGGNDAYQAADYPLAKAYYRHALKDTAEPDYRNNLGLTLLQLEENSEALEIFRGLTAEFPTSYGYWVNLLVAAHANGISSQEIFDQTGGWSYFSQLAAAAQELPGDYTKTLEAILYNAVYMDMELSDEELANSGGFIYGAAGVDPAMLEAMVAAAEYDYAFHTVLMGLDELNTAVYGEGDPDIAALEAYLNAKSSQ